MRFFSYFWLFRFGIQMVKITLKYGITTAGLLVGWDILLYNYLFRSAGWFAVIVQIVIIATGISLAIREAKIKNQRIISYKNATFTGLLTTLYAAILYSLSVYLFYPYGNSDFTTEFLKITTEKLTEIGKTPAEIQEGLKLTKKILLPANMAQSAFYNTGIFGILFTLLFSVLFRLKQPNQNDKNQ